MTAVAEPIQLTLFDLAPTTRAIVIDQNTCCAQVPKESAIVCQSPATHVESFLGWWPVCSEHRDDTAVSLHNLRPNPDGPGWLADIDTPVDLSSPATTATTSWEN